MPCRCAAQGMCVYRVWRDDAYLRDMMLLLQELQVRLVDAAQTVLRQLACLIALHAVADSHAHEWCTVCAWQGMCKRGWEVHKGPVLLFVTHKCCSWCTAWLSTFQVEAIHRNLAFDWPPPRLPCRHVTCCGRSLPGLTASAGLRRTSPS